ncbi:MAG: hypothetical protein AAFN79_18395 [Pseudomonadota bacterium]
MRIYSAKTWALLGLAGGVGFGAFAAPLIYILINMFYDGVSLNQTINFAIGNGFTWGVFGLIAGVFLFGVFGSRVSSLDD